MNILRQHLNERSPRSDFFDQPGEAAGYLYGLRDAEEKFVLWELNTPRIG